MKLRFIGFVFALTVVFGSLGTAAASPTTTSVITDSASQTDEGAIRAAVEQSIDGLALGTVTAASVGETYTDATFIFLQYCRPTSRCGYEQINDYSYTDWYYGAVVNQVSFWVPTNRHGRYLTVGFKFPSWMYCGYYDTRGAYHSGWGDQLRVRSATAVYCGWYTYLT